MAAGKILIVEDEVPIREMIAFHLVRAGFETLEAGDCRSARQLLADERPDLALIDWMLPDMSGLELTRTLKRDQGFEDLGIIMLTARADEYDKVAGLEGGADDYMAKPFRFEELVARIRLRLREDRSPEAMVLRSGHLTLDLRTRRLTVGDREVELSAREFTLAETFLRNPGQVLTREQLLSRVWGYDFDPGSNVVDVYVGYLRRKVGPEYVVTVRGMGYRLDDTGGRR